jgi:hypothetical protein
MVVIAHIVRLFWTGTLAIYYRRPTKGSCSELFKLARQPIKGSQTVCQILEEFCSLLFDILWRFAMLQDPWRSGYMWSQNEPPPPPKPLQQSWFIICQHTATVHLSQVTNTVPDTTCFIWWRTVTTTARHSRRLTTGCSKWRRITNLGTTSRKEHKYSSFVKISETPHINKESLTLSVSIFFKEIFHLLVDLNLYYWQHLDKLDLATNCPTSRCWTWWLSLP